MQRAGNELFPGTGRAGDQRSSEVRSDTPYTREKVAHEGTLPNHPFETMRAEHLAVQLHCVVASFRFRRQAADAEAKIRYRYGFGEVVTRPLLDCFQCGVRGVMTRQ